jgi:hypothetical protein
VASTCPADVFLSNATVCRAAVAGGCDVAENCTGSSAVCPADAVRAAGTSCRASAGVCDAAEVCTGASNACPIDVNLLAPSISLSSGTACAGGTVTVSFTLNASSATTYGIQLSSYGGSFATPTVLATYTPGATGLVNIVVTIPAGTILGAGYFIRVVGGTTCISNTIAININC